MLKFDIPKRKLVRFSEVNYLNCTKKDPILHVTTTFSLKHGETRTSSGPIPHPLMRFLKRVTSFEAHRSIMSKKASLGCSLLILLMVLLIYSWPWSLYSFVLILKLFSDVASAFMHIKRDVKESMNYPNSGLTEFLILFLIKLKWQRWGVPSDPRFVFRAFYYFRFRFFHRHFFLMSNYRIPFFWRKKNK